MIDMSDERLMGSAVARRVHSSARPSVEPPLVSVIIPTLRRPALLRRALQSVLAQTYPSIEVWVIENGDSTPARAVIEELGGAERGLHFEHVAIADPHLARNIGIERARGAYCAFLDDDDEWLPEKLARQIECLEADRALGWVACGAWTIDDEGRAELAQTQYYRGVPSLRALVREWCFVWSLSCVVVRRDCFERVGSFLSRYRIAGDYELYLRLARQYRFAVLEEPLVRYHRHQSNLTNDLHRTWQEILRILSRLEPAPEQSLCAEDMREAIRQYCRWYYALGITARKQGRYRQAATYFAAAVRHDPAVGLKIPGGSFRHPIYRMARPYAGAAVCGLKALLGRGEA